MRETSGFSLVELMIIVVLISIVAGIAVPNLSPLIKNSRLSSQANGLIIAINLARSEAIKRNLEVFICRSADGTSCASNGGWEQGWVVYADLNSNSILDAGEELRVYPALAKGNTLRPTSNYEERVRYLARGYVSQEGAFILCDDRSGDGDTNDAEDFASGRAIIISPTGRPRIDEADNSTFTSCET
jgi:type IV fimbrial biogenesis protein FimT